MKKFLVLYLVSFASLNVYSNYTLDQETTIAEINGISLAYKSIGMEEDPPVLMVMGLLASHKVWGETIVNGLVDSGYRVILFDNRDTGDSEKLDMLVRTNLYWKYFLYSLGIGFNAPYTLEDMAYDGGALLDHLDIEEAHIIGASMGGMIAKIIPSEEFYDNKKVKTIIIERNFLDVASSAKQRWSGNWGKDYTVMDWLKDDYIPRYKFLNSFRNDKRLLWLNYEECFDNKQIMADKICDFLQNPSLLNSLIFVGMFNIPSSN